MLLEKDSSVSIYNRNIPCLTSEMYKVSNGLSPPVVSNILTQKKCYSNKDILPDSYKNLSKFSIFKNRIKKNGNLRIAPADFRKHAFLESALHRLSLQ